MSIVELFLIAVGLAMDAFAVSVCKGLAMDTLRGKDALIIALYFGVFQAAMPLLGYFLGFWFQSVIESIDHWIAFVLLAIIGINMIRESRKGEETADASVGFRIMLLLAIATSIDALAVGITFAFLQVDIVPAVALIGVVTFIISLLGVKIGNVFGSRYKARAEMAGGIILIAIGTKILLEHLGLLPF